MADEPVAAPAAQSAQPTTNRIPRPAAHKIQVAAVAGSATIVIIWAVHVGLGLEIPAEVAQAFTMLGATGLSMLVPDDMEA